MIRKWDLLKTWIESNREALRRREHIRARLRLWEEEGRDPTLLLTGRPLDEARKFLADHGDVLIDEVQPYIAASLAADEERRRQAEAAAAQFSNLLSVLGMMSLKRDLKPNSRTLMLFVKVTKS